MVDNHSLPYNAGGYYDRNLMLGFVMTSLIKNRIGLLPDAVPLKKLIYAGSIF